LPLYAKQARPQRDTLRLYQCRDSLIDVLIFHLSYFFLILLVRLSQYAVALAWILLRLGTKMGTKLTLKDYTIVSTVSMIIEDNFLLQLLSISAILGPSV